MPHLIAAFLGLAVAFVVGATTDEIIRNVYDPVNQAFQVNVVAGTAGATPAGNNGDLQINSNDTALGAYAGDACPANEAAISIDSAGQLTCDPVSSGIESGVTVITSGVDKAVCFDDTGEINCADGVTFDKTQDFLQTRSYAITVPNAGVTGTTLNKLTKIDASGQAIIVGTTDTDDAIGICVSGCGTTGDASIALLGNVNCIFDSATTAGNYIGVDTSTAGNCTDLGAAFPATGVSVVGRVLSTNGAGGTYAVNLNTPDVASVSVAGGGGGSAKRLNVITITSAASPYNLASTGDILLLADTSGGSITVNLPNLGANDLGKVYHVKKTSVSNTLTLDGDSGDTIDGATTFDWNINNQAYSITPATTSTWVLY